jgi:hypothetical protein
VVLRSYLTRVIMHVELGLTKKIYVYYFFFSEIHVYYSLCMIS